MKMILNSNGDYQKDFGVNEKIGDGKRIKKLMMSIRMRRRIKTRIKDIDEALNSTKDPYAETLRWWEKEPIKYA